MGVDLVGEEEPGPVGVGGDRPGDMHDEVGLGAGGAEGGGEDLSLGGVEVGDQAERAVADVLALAPLRAAGAHGLGRCGAFEGLDAGQFGGAENMAAESFQHRRVGIGGGAVSTWSAKVAVSSCLALALSQ